MIDTLLTIWRVGVEHSGAWTAAMKSIERGDSYLDAARAFSAHTENDLDDAAVEQLAVLLEQGVDALRQAAAAAGRAAAALELWAPSVLTRVNQVGVVALQIANRLDSLKRDDL